MRAAPAALAALSLLPTTAAADVQSERDQLIKELIRMGVFLKVEKPARLCRLYTGPRWPAATIDQKRAFANVVYSYCVTADPSANIVIIRDGYSGKDIGEYSSYVGLKLQ